MVELYSSQLDQVFHALADPTRRAMLADLRDGERSVGELAAPHRISLAAASKHIKTLERAGLLRRTVIGRTELNGGSSVVISISDSGPGIPADKLAQVFDPFFTTKDQGMGIGLSIARTIILAHKGQIWAENQSGGGAAFHFTLPLAA